MWIRESKENPGLGDKREKGKSNFSVQFQGKNPATTKIAVTKDGGEIDAITASTISSRAYAEAVNRAYKAFIEETTGATWEGTTGATSTTGNDNKSDSDASSGATSETDKNKKDGTTGSTTPATDTVKVNKEANNE